LLNEDENNEDNIYNTEEDIIKSDKNDKHKIFNDVIENKNRIDLTSTYNSFNINVKSNDKPKQINNNQCKIKFNGRNMKKIKLDEVWTSPIINFHDTSYTIKGISYHNFKQIWTTN
jgi:hypothetical protein